MQVSRPKEVTIGDELTMLAAERALRCVRLGRKAWVFCGSDCGGERAAVIYSLIQTVKLDDVDPQTWLADVLARIADHPVILGLLDHPLTDGSQAS